MTNPTSTIGIVRCPGQRRHAAEMDGEPSQWPNPRAALSIWHRLAAAREHYDPRVLAEAEDVVFRFYLPLAHELADGQSVNPAVSRAEAELGLAKAVLAWNRPDPAGFEEYARGAVLCELRQSAGGHLGHNALTARLRQVTDAPCAS